MATTAFVFAFLLAILILAGAFYQWMGTRRTKRLFRPPGKMIEVDGQRLHVVCTGNGRPVVLFESGIAASSLSWTSVSREVSTFTRACSYDRAGLGWSDPSAGPRTVARMMADLHGVLSEASPTGPAVLVGHSFGAWLVCAYASQRRGDVAALVLLDPPSEWHQLSPYQARLLRGAIQLSRLGGILARFGVVRACLALLTGGAPGVPRSVVRVFGPTAVRTLERLIGEVRKLPPEVHPELQAIWCQPKCFRAMADHLAVLEETAAAVALVASLPDVPLAIVSSGDQPLETVAKHRQLARLSSQGRHVIASKSGHWIQFDQPDPVVGIVREIVERTRHTSAA